jgi:probable HAF family extracellular repeat protein
MTATDPNVGESEHAKREQLMKSKSLISIAMTLCASLVSFPLAAQEGNNLSAAPSNTYTYTVTNLGSLGGTSCCFVITNNDRGWVDGTSNLAGDQSFHPFLWRDGKMQDLGTLGGPNASAGQMNDRGDVTVGGADTGIPDPLGEDFCGFGTHQICLSYVWHSGKKTVIPTLGGNNADVSAVHDDGKVLVALGETAIPDPTCTSPQVLGFQSYVWDPDTGVIQVLRALAGYSASAAFDWNDNGQAVGTSAQCSALTTGSPEEATLWQDGQPTYLGTLGGTTNNFAFGINNRGQVVGVSDLVGDNVNHAFLWTEADGMQDLGTLPGDVYSTTGNINDKGQVAIESCDINFTCRAAIWQDGKMTDLNTLIPPSSSLFLMLANWINSRGEIVGAAVDESTGAIVPFLATPCDAKHTHVKGCGYGAEGAAVRGESLRPNFVPPENVREQLRKQRGFGRVGLGR